MAVENEEIEKGRITQLLLEINGHNREAYDRLFSLVYEQLRYIARNQLASRPAEGALRKTELIHEVYLKLIDQTQTEWRDRAHFYAVAAKAMRHILVDHYRRRQSQKRGGSLKAIPWDEEHMTLEAYSGHLLAIHELMSRLAEVDERMHTIVDLRFFAGMTIPEIAGLLNISTSTVDRDWVKARGWLFQQLVRE